MTFAFALQNHKPLHSFPLFINIFGVLCLLLPLISARGSVFSNVYPKPLPGPKVLAEDVGDPLILTPYIQRDELAKARKLSRVTNLTSVVSYSGYFTVDTKYDSNLFFWFFPAAYNPESAPVLLWLQGGPGGSSLFGLFAELGPFVVDSNNNLQFRNTAWTLTHSVIFIDQPAGTGYSFTKDDRGFARNQQEIAEGLYEALQQFFTLFPEYQERDFFLSGESYAGKYVPAIAYKIHTENQGSPSIRMNLKGLAIGDGFSDPLHMIDYGEYLFNIGLLDYNDKLYFQQEESKAKDLIRKEKFLEAFTVMDKLLNGWNNKPSYYENVTGFHRYYNYLHEHEPADLNYYSSFVQLDYVRRAMHVGNTTFADLNLTGKVEGHLIQDIYKSVKTWIEQLLDAPESYQILMYSGQLDIIVASTLTDNFIRTMNWKGAEEFSKAPRKIWRVSKEIAGYSKTASTLTQLVVRNAGHMVPYDQPYWAFDMINRFTSGKAF